MHGIAEMSDHYIFRLKSDENSSQINGILFMSDYLNGIEINNLCGLLFAKSLNLQTT